MHFHITFGTPLKISYTLVDGYVTLRPKFTKHPIQKCIGSALTIMKSNNGTNFSHFEKCFITTKTYWFYFMVKQKKGRQNPNSTAIQAP
jgi:hypothetical protein